MATVKVGIRKTTEHDQQTAVFAVLRLNEKKYPHLQWVYAIPNGSYRHPRTAGRLWAEGVKEGIADICIPIPDKHYFHGCYIEMKAGRNKPTQEQLRFLNFAASQRYFTAVCYSADECLDVIEKYLEIKLVR